MNNIFSKLKSEEFEIKYYGFSLAKSLRTTLSRDPQVLNLRDLYRANLISEEQILQFAQSLLCEFKQGEIFPHQTALAAIAVALESFPSDFAQDYLLQLSRLNCPELQRTIHVARLSIKFQIIAPEVIEKEECQPSISLDPGYQFEVNEYLSEETNSLETDLIEAA